MAIGGLGLATAAGPVRREILENGMTVIVQDTAAAAVVAMTLFVHVGSRHEPAEGNGVTALLGRVLLKGTRMRTALEIARAAEDAGGGIESGADQEYAEVRARGLARDWRTLLRLVHEVVTAPSLASDEIEREREGLLAQIRGLDDQPFQVGNRLLSRALYGDHAYGRPTTGEPDSVRRLTRGDLARHLDAFYTPDRMVLVVSGQVPAREVLVEAARLFGGAPRGSPPPLPVPPPQRPTRARDQESRPTRQAQILMGFLAPPLGHLDHVALKVANAVLGSGMSSRLFRALRDDAGLAYAVGALYPTRRETGRIVIHVGTVASNAGAAEAGIRREIERLRTERVPDEELARAKAFLGGSFALDLRTSARQGFYLGFFELMGVGHDYVVRYPQLIEAVTGPDVLRVARRHLVEPSVVIVGPG